MSDSDCKHDELKRTSDVTDDGALIQPTDVALRNRITSYLANNESLKPEQVSDLLRDCRRALAAQAASVTDGALRASVIDWKARFDELSAEFAILSRACGNWRTWPNEVESDHDHPDWKVAAKAILTVRALAAQASSDPLDKPSGGGIMANAPNNVSKSGIFNEASEGAYKVQAYLIMDSPISGQPTFINNLYQVGTDIAGAPIYSTHKPTAATATPDTAPMGASERSHD